MTTLLLGRLGENLYSKLKFKFWSPWKNLFVTRLTCAHFLAPDTPVGTVTSTVSYMQMIKMINNLMTSSSIGHDFNFGPEIVMPWFELIQITWWQESTAGRSGGGNSLGYRYRQLWRENHSEGESLLRQAAFRPGENSSFREASM